LGFGRGLVFLLALHMGVGGSAWATVLSQLISAVLCTVSGARKYPVLHLKKDDFSGMRRESSIHLRIGFPMGFQMSVMCIGQLAMQAAVNAIRSEERRVAKGCGDGRS